MIEPDSVATRRLRRVVNAGCFVLASLCLTPAFAQDLRVPADGRLRHLSALYTADGVTIVSDVCAQRFSQTRGDWDQALGAWRQGSRESLAELERLQATVGVALRKDRATSVNVDTLAAIVNARFEWVATVYQMLASMSDSEAKPYCDSARLGFSHASVDADTMSQARTAAAAAVEDLGEKN